MLELEGFAEQGDFATMTVTEEYDKFDNKWEIVTSGMALSNTDPRIGVVSSNFAYVVGQGFEVGWLIMYRNAKNWGWLTDDRAVLVADNLRVEHTSGLRENEVLDNGNVFERIDIALSKEQVLAFISSNEIPAIRIDGAVFDFVGAYVQEVREAYEKGQAKKV